MVIGDVRGVPGGQGSTRGVQGGQDGRLGCSKGVERDVMGIKGSRGVLGKLVPAKSGPL